MKKQKNTTLSEKSINNKSKYNKTRIFYFRIL